MKKDKILEIIDDENNIIGTEDAPENGKNLETQAKRTTDYNMKIHGQEFGKDGFLWRFGFYFYEGKTTDKKLVEDTLNNKFDNEFVTKSKEELIKKEKLTKVADLLNKLSDNDVEQLVNILIEKENE